MENRLQTLKQIKKKNQEPKTNTVQLVCHGRKYHKY